MAANLAVQLKNELFSRYSLVPSDQWLHDFISTGRNPSHPLPALTSTAHFRLLTTDITASLSSQQGQTLPATISDLNTKEIVLQKDTPVQVLDVVDISTSKWSQIEAIERVERGEEIRGREVIRNVPGANDDNDDTNNLGRGVTSTARSSVASTDTSPSIRKGSTGPHKLLLQDVAGTKVWAFEVSRIERITIVNMNPPLSAAARPAAPVEGMQIGCKLILKKGTKARRGLVMMQPANVTILGGKIEVWDKTWREGRKARLRQQLDAENGG